MTAEGLDTENPQESPAYDTVECWRCGEDRYTYESCMNCGASCKPLKKKKQQKGERNV